MINEVGTKNLVHYSQCFYCYTPCKKNLWFKLTLKDEKYKNVRSRLSIMAAFTQEQKPGVDCTCAEGTRMMRVTPSDNVTDCVKHFCSLCRSSEH